MRSLSADAHIHLIALCGTAMGSLAAMLRERGYRVTGSDHHVYPPMSDFLAESGIPVLDGFDAARLSPPPELVVVGNAVSRGNVELEAVLSQRIPYTSLPEVLRDVFLCDCERVVITGTHGKTTTTALTAHMLATAGRDPSFLVAGIAANFDRPYHLGQGAHFVVEGDEYDSAFFAKVPKFQFYLPDVLVINNIEFDHADIYRDLEDIERVFSQLINTVPANGLVLANGDDPVIGDLVARSFAKVQTFGLGTQNHWRATRLESSGMAQTFTALEADSELLDARIPLSGAYNVRNALGAIGVCARAGLAADEMAAGLETFRGIRRRQEILLNFGGVMVVDDFAHHPTAVGQTLAGLREACAEARLRVVFEPASATNARALFEERYVDAFETADEVIIARVPRPERSGSATPFSPQRLAAKLADAGQTAHFIPEVDDIVGHLIESLGERDLVVFMSNSGFGGIQAKLVAGLREKLGDTI